MFQNLMSCVVNRIVPFLWNISIQFYLYYVLPKTKKNIKIILKSSCKKIFISPIIVQDCKINRNSAVLFKKEMPFLTTQMLNNSKWFDNFGPHKSLFA